MKRKNQNSKVAWDLPSFDSGKDGSLLFSDLDTAGFFSSTTLLGDGSFLVDAVFLGATGSSEETSFPSGHYSG